MTIAYQIAALTKTKQMLLLDAMVYSQESQPSLSSGQRLKKASTEGTLLSGDHAGGCVHPRRRKRTVTEKLTLSTDAIFSAK